MQVEEFRLDVLGAHGACVLDYVGPTMLQSKGLLWEVWHIYTYSGTNLITRASGKDPFAVRAETNAVDASIMRINVVNWRIGRLVSSIPSLIQTWVSAVVHTDCQQYTYIINLQSSPTDANIVSYFGCHATSYIESHPRKDKCVYVDTINQPYLHRSRVTIVYI